MNWFDKIKFDEYFDKKLAIYAKYIDIQMNRANCNFLEMERAKIEFRENIYRYCERMLNAQAKTSQGEESKKESTEKEPSNKT